MIEFLIRTRDDHDFPAVRRDRLSHVLTPAGWDCVPSEGWGDYRLRCGDTDVSFAGESAGWEVSFEGPMPEEVATRMIAIVAAQIEQELNQPVESIQIS
jgi:hypothetical protein